MQATTITDGDRSVVITREQRPGERYTARLYVQGGAVKTALRVKGSRPFVDQRVSALLAFGR